jgi:uncharacterized protein with HEPN domain
MKMRLRNICLIFKNRVIYGYDKIDNEIVWGIIVRC